MKNKPLAIAAAFLLSVAMSAIAMADTVVGGNKVAVPASSDALVTVPFVQPSAGKFTATGNNGSNAINITGPLTVDQYKSTFYVRITSGNAIGRWSTISGNAATSLTLSDTSFVTDIVSGTTFEIIPHQTLAKVFPDSLKGIAFTETPVGGARTTEIIVPDTRTTTTGINKSALNTYFYSDGAWRRFGSPATFSANNVTIDPQAYFILRNNTANALTFVTSGEVMSTMQRSRKLANESVQNDTAACSGNPFPVKLIDLVLGGTPAFTNTTDPGSLQDVLLVFDNTVPGQNKSASNTYYFYNGKWRRFGSSASFDASNVTVPAGAAIVIRKVAGAGSNSWMQPANY